MKTVKLSGLLVAALLVLSATAQAADRVPKIIGGTGISAGEYPYTVALVTKSSRSNWAGQFCGGALIAADWVLTAAHCVDGMQAAEIEVVVAEPTLSVSAATNRINVDVLIVHPEWDAALIANDIALLHLDNADPEFALTGAITLPSLATDADVALLIDDDLVTAIGWGYSSHDPDFGSRPLLQKIDLDFITTGTCQGYWTPVPIAVDVICAGVVDMGVVEDDKGSCYGDSGSPLLDGNMIVGVTSFGPDGCANGGLPAGYANVGYHRDYIDFATTSPEISVAVVARGGTPATVDVIVSNLSPVNDATNVLVAFYQSRNFVITNLAMVPGCSEEDYSCTIAAIPAGDEVVLTLEVEVESSGRAWLEARAMIDDYNPANNRAVGNVRGGGDSLLSKGGSLPGAALLLLALLGLRRRR